MFKSILLVGVALAAALVVEAKPDIVFASGLNMKGERTRCEDLDYQVCYGFPGAANLQSLKFTNYDFPDEKDFSITLYHGAACNDQYDRWSFKQSDDGKDTINGWKSLHLLYSFKIANFQTSNVSGGHHGVKDITKVPNCWQEFPVKKIPILQLLLTISPTMFKSILLVGLALAASFVVEAKPDIVFATGKNMQGDTYRCEELDYQVCYSSSQHSGGQFPDNVLPINVQSLKFTNYDFPDHKDFSITIYDGAYCNYWYDRWSFKQSDDGKDTINGWNAMKGVYSFKIANFQTSNVSNGKIGKGMEQTHNPRCWKE
ncbi:MAG: hypothetical protein J3R72DRAFT_522766 [Linnemannia gamsii]|nr:MAG: hypothetical protein J3R72DRAFT_522766 [Linnemannia gamsii]